VTDEGAVRNLIGLAAAWRRGDKEGVQALRPGPGEDPRRLFVPAFAAITQLADDVGKRTERRPEDVLENVRQEAAGTMTATVAEVAIAGLAGDGDRFNRIGEAASKAGEFIPSIFHVLGWLAEQIALATGTTVDAVFSDYAMTAAAGEAGMFDG
jgi:hypothetical protein